MKYVVAVSGGVDSVVLLDMLAQSGEHELVVAHFDHGIRPDSDADARFVEKLAEFYGVVFRGTTARLGPQASEATAREKRYEFLHALASEFDGMVVTAHHQDDAVETIAINLTRGTGWRGLAVLGRPDIHRPLLASRKSELMEYALTHGLEWVEDETNSTDAYLRNRLRRKLALLPAEPRAKLVALRARQLELAAAIDAETEVLANESRYFMTMIDESVALELLHGALANVGLTLTRPQRLRLLHAIRTAKAGSTFQAGTGTVVALTTREFIVKHP